MILNTTIMRMLVLTSIRFTTGPNAYEYPMLAVVSGSPEEGPNVIMRRATDAVEREFNHFYPESKLEHIIPRPTFGQYGISEMPQLLGNDYPSFHSSNELPKDLGEGYSDDVLIDVDGWRTTFRVGWYDFDEKKWVIDAASVAVDQVNMKWTYLPLAK